MFSDRYWFWHLKDNVMHKLFYLFHSGRVHHARYKSCLCLTSAPDISSLRPDITADIIMVNKSNGENIYFCDVKSYTESLLYQIEWTLSTVPSDAKIVHQSDFIQYESKEAFRLATSLREQHLRDNNITKIGYTVSKHLMRYLMVLLWSSSPPHTLCLWITVLKIAQHVDITHKTLLFIFILFSSNQHSLHWF